jgi:hypothetical protein
MSSTIYGFKMIIIKKNSEEKDRFENDGDLYDNNEPSQNE